MFQLGKLTRFVTVGRISVHFVGVLACMHKWIKWKINLSYLLVNYSSHLGGGASLKFAESIFSFWNAFLLDFVSASIWTGICEFNSRLHWRSSFVCPDDWLVKMFSLFHCLNAIPAAIYSVWSLLHLFQILTC